MFIVIGVINHKGVSFGRFVHACFFFEPFPLCYDHEIKDLVFFYKAIHGHIKLDIDNFVSFASHGRTRLSEARILRTPLCRTSTFQASYFNRIVKICNSIVINSNSRNFSSLSLFKAFGKDMFNLDLVHTGPDRMVNRSI